MRPTSNTSAPIGLGILGCGTTARRYLAGISDSWSLRAVMDSDPLAARQLAKEVSSARAYADHWDLLGDETVGAVLITSPVWIRGHQALESLEAGKHVICHAPAALYLQDCDRLSRTAEDRGVVMMTAFPLRQTQVIHGTVRQIEDGIIGEPILVRCDRSSYLSRAERQSGPRTWQELFTIEAGETADLSRWILGAHLTVSADVQQATPGSKRPEDIGNVIIQHDRGLSIHHISRVSHQTPVERYLVDGAEGTLLIERGRTADATFVVTLFRHGKFVRVVTDECVDRAECNTAPNEFYARIVANATPDSGRESVECVSAAFLSSAEDRKVTLPLLSGPPPCRLLPSADPKDARRAIR